jgi:hypothetical protein
MVVHGTGAYKRRLCRCRICKSKYKQDLRRRRKTYKPDNQVVEKPRLNPMATKYDAMTLGEWKKEQLNNPPQPTRKRHETY